MNKSYGAITFFVLTGLVSSLTASDLTFANGGISRRPITPVEALIISGLCSSPKKPVLRNTGFFFPHYIAGFHGSPLKTVANDTGVTKPEGIIPAIQTSIGINQPSSIEVQPPYPVNVWVGNADTTQLQGVASVIPPISADTHKPMGGIAEIQPANPINIEGGNAGTPKLETVVPALPPVSMDTNKPSAGIEVQPPYPNPMNIGAGNADIPKPENVVPVMPANNDNNKPAVGVFGKISTYFDEYVGKKATWTSRCTVLGGASLILGSCLYQTVPSVKVAIDNARESTHEFAQDCIHNKGNARRNAVIGVVATIGTGLAAYKLYYGAFPFVG